MPVPLMQTSNGSMSNEYLIALETVITSKMQLPARFRRLLRQMCTTFLEKQWVLRWDMMLLAVYLLGRAKDMEPSAHCKGQMERGSGFGREEQGSWSSTRKESDLRASNTS